MAKQFARTFGQDLMRGEHIVGGGKMSRKANAEPSGGGGGWKKMNQDMARNRAKLRGLAIGTQDLVQDKISEGDIDGGMSSGQSGTSIFDPVLCEIAYHWFCPKGGTVLDPFAGGSVRGIVASRLGRKYVGVELRQEQVEANRAQLKIAKSPKPEWRVGDSRKIATIAEDVNADLIFSCPPYWNLEVYSEDPADISTLGKEEFFEAQAEIIKASIDRLKPDRFAVWIVGDVRDKDGFYANLPGRTVMAFEAAGARFYNDAILVTSVGSLPVRIFRQFQGARKLGKTHQNILVFCKGDPKKATEAIGDVEFGDVQADAGEMQAMVEGLGGAV